MSFFCLGAFLRERVKIFEKGGIITKKILGPSVELPDSRVMVPLVWRKYFNRLLVFDWTGISGGVDSSELIISIEEASEEFVAGAEIVCCGKTEDRRLNRVL